MDYRRELGSIQADLARRAGLLLKQYDQLAQDLPEAQKYDATLTVAVLGLLLVNCKESLEVLEKDDRIKLLGPEVHRLVLDRQQSNFPPRVDGQEVAAALTHLRNAVSHPLPPRRNLAVLTGYTTRPTEAAAHSTVGALEFTSSPWMLAAGSVKRDYKSSDLGRVRSAFGRFKQTYRCDGLLEVAEYRPGVHTVVRSDTGDAYLPVFTLTLTVAQAGELALLLANFLAHASRESWVGDQLFDLLTA